MVSAVVALAVGALTRPTGRARRRALALGGDRGVGGARFDLVVVVRAAVVGFSNRLDPLGRRHGRYGSWLAGALEDLARSLRSGASLGQALREVSSSGGNAVERDLAAVVARVDAGETVSTALGWWRDRRPESGVVLAVAALDLASDVGGSRARAVDQVAATLRERLALAGELRAQSSQARLSAVVLIVAPVVFACVAAVTDPRVLAFLVTEPLGWACVTAGVVLDAAGGVWMTRVTRSPW